MTISVIYAPVMPGKNNKSNRYNSDTHHVNIVRLASMQNPESCSLAQTLETAAALEETATLPALPPTGPRVQPQNRVALGLVRSSLAIPIWEGFGPKFEAPDGTISKP